jgi:hypothetical protein
MKGTDIACPASLRELSCDEKSLAVFATILLGDQGQKVAVVNLFRSPDHEFGPAPSAASRPADRRS